MKYTIGQFPICEGKTKIIWQVAEGDWVKVQSKPTITAHDNPALTQTLYGKDVWATTTTCRVFELLRLADIPVAYREQLSSTEFLAERCNMIPIEAVARRYAVGSYLKRNPHLTAEPGQPPYRFPKVVREFFLKTTKGQLKVDDHLLVDGLDPLKGEEDPLIINPFDAHWLLAHSKKPASDPTAILSKTVLRKDIISDLNIIQRMDAVLGDVFSELEDAWENLDYHLIDLKIEFGVTASGDLVVADVIDNDSWRLRTNDWEELSKEVFRQGGSLAQNAKNYELVAELVSQF